MNLSKRFVMVAYPLVASAALGACALSEASPGDPLDETSEVTVVPQELGARPLETCLQVQEASSGQLNDGEYLLYLDGDATKPWIAYCADLATAFPKEYLTLHRSLDANFAQYTVGGAVSGTNVRTRYSKLRIDPVNRTVDPTDRRFSTSTGATSINSMPITSVDYGTAASCDYLASGIANIDLQFTGFAVARDSFELHGYLPVGSATYSINDQVVDLTGGGYCGLIAAGKSTLPLVYLE